MEEEDRKWKIDPCRTHLTFTFCTLFLSQPHPLLSFPLSSSLIVLACHFFIFLLSPKLWSWIRTTIPPGGLTVRLALSCLLTGTERLQLSLFSWRLLSFSSLAWWSNQIINSRSHSFWFFPLDSGKVKEHMPKGTESYMSLPHPWLRLCWSPPNCWLGTARVGFTQHGVDLPSTPPLFSPPQGFRLLWLLASIPVSCLCQPWIIHFLSRLCRSHPFILKNWIPCHPIWWSSVVKELFVCREKRVFRGYE